MAYLSGLGERVVRPAAELGLADTYDIFTIAGGAVLITQLVGRVTVLMDATASTLRLAHSVGPTNICGALAAIADDAVETLYTVSGDLADLMYKAEGAVGGAVRGGLNGGLAAGAGVIAKGILMLPGTITYTNSGDQTGEVEWTVCYIPITVGATVVAA